MSLAPAGARPMLSPNPRRWLITRLASRLLSAEAARLAADSTNSARGPGQPSNADARAQLDGIRLVLANAELVEDTRRVAIGHRVTICEADGTLATFALVLPGDGDPALGYLGADAPVAAAIIGRSRGDVVEVTAPAGARALRIVDVAAPPYSG